MDLLTTSILAVVVGALVMYLWSRRSRLRLPPCPTRPWPIVGHLFTLKEDPRPQFAKWREEVGDIFSLYMGSTLMIVLSGYDLLKETMVKRADEFSDRPAFFIDEVTGLPMKGIIMSSGPAWKEQRAITVSTLRAFGMGKNILAQNIHEEVGCFLQSVSELNGEATDLRVLINLSTSNIICSIIVGQRFEYDDETFKDLMAKLYYITSDMGAINIVSFMPWLRHLPGDLFKAKKTEFCTKQVLDMFVSKFVNKKGRDEYDEDNIDNFIAAYMKEWKRKTDANEPTTMDEGHLVKIIWDLFGAGTTTGSTTILWCLLYALNYPDAQQKIYKEIEQHVGKERRPTMQDKQKLTYLNAFIMEVQRLANVAGAGITHTCPEDVTLRGYTIPKGTYIVMDFDSVSFDKAIWGEDVNTFRPERFIDANGKLKHMEELIPFGMGRRICPGEGVAKMELFLYLSAMFQRFRFEPPEPASPPPLDYIVGLDICPKPFKVRGIERETTTT